MSNTIKLVAVLGLVGLVAACGQQEEDVIDTFVPITVGLNAFH